eukprot:Gregarina_sp_Poly_1__10350@NODE_736_length_6543_cov_173_732705_g4_i1_p3_GENE_NODE_736_length_6543_cov_173_732705_g4_i1NODE_736_length_6543_cov_173_732705_g4_i1_p3_ORF_typecomplete_len424_score60_57A_deaminase/PF00962_22/6_3e02A_deaminase/PF00962_22/4_2e07TAFA/PF12020_8/0_31_NODE_736_length_6543_cov_173_732705_g4_i191280
MFNAQLFNVHENSRSSYLEKLPQGGTVRSKCDTVSIDGRGAHDDALLGGKVVRSPLLTSPDGFMQPQVLDVPGAGLAESHLLQSYIRLFLPSSHLALRASRDVETVAAVKMLTSLIAVRHRFIHKWHIFDSPAVVPRSAGEQQRWGTTEPMFRPQDCGLLPNLSGHIGFECGVLAIFTDLSEEQSGDPESPEKAIKIDSSENAREYGIETARARDATKASGAISQYPRLKSTLGVPTVEEYLTALRDVMKVVQDPACKTLCYQRLRYLEERFSFHLLFNGSQEIADVRNNNHRDFYNVRKVDTHVHHSACMTQKHLLRFIRRKYRLEGDTAVAKDPVTGEPVSLAEIFQHDLGLTAWETSIDHLNVHALNSCFHRFDVFNSKLVLHTHTLSRYTVSCCVCLFSLDIIHSEQRFCAKSSLKRTT